MCFTEISAPVAAISSTYSQKPMKTMTSAIRPKARGPNIGAWMANSAIAKICLNRFWAVIQDVGEIFFRRAAMAVSKGVGVRRLRRSAPLENEPGECLDEALGMKWNQAVQILHRPA